MPDFFLIDPAIKGLTGHFYQYAAHVLDAADAAGRFAVLAINRKMTIVETRYETHPVFRYANALDRDEIPLLATAGRIVDWGKCAARRIFGERSLRESAQRAAPLEPSGSGRLFRIAVNLVTQIKIRQLARDLRDLFERRTLKCGDVVLIPSAGELELLGLDRYLRAAKLPDGIKWHLQFHGNLFRGRDPDHPGQQPALVLGASRFQSATTRLRAKGVSFYTDTAELSRQYERLGAGPFAVLPIPHTLAVGRCRELPACVRVGYLGDARSEKGFYHLPQVVDELWDELVETGHAAFTIQANDSLLRDDPPIPVARELLGQRPAEKVELIRRALSPKEYQDLLQRCDVALLPYDAEIYFARSSGIMAEALAAGIPVIVPAGTWLSRQFESSVQEHIAAVREKRAVIGAAEFHAGRGDRTWQFQVAIPDGTCFVAGCFAATNTGPGKFLKLRMDLLDATGIAVACRHALVSAEDACHPAWFLLAIDKAPARVRFTVSELARQPSLTLSRCQLEFLGVNDAQGRGPISRVGVAWADPSDLADMVREIVEHYPHYRQTAMEFATDFFGYHNADHYLRELIGSEGVSDGDHRRAPAAKRPGAPIAVIGSGSSDQLAEVQP